MHTATVCEFSALPRKMSNGSTGKTSTPSTTSVGQSPCRKTAAPFALTPSTTNEAPQIVARLIPSIAIIKTVMAARVPRNILAKCRSSANGPLAGSGPGGISSGRMSVSKGR